MPDSTILGPEVPRITAEVKDFPDHPSECEFLAKAKDFWVYFIRRNYYLSFIVVLYPFTEPDNADESEILLSGSVKWDGCTNLDIGDSREAATETTSAGTRTRRSSDVP